MASHSKSKRSAEPKLREAILYTTNPQRYEDFMKLLESYNYTVKVKDHPGGAMVDPCLESSLRVDEPVMHPGEYGVLLFVLEAGELYKGRIK